MALQLDFQIMDTSVVVTDAYWKITTISGGKEGFDVLVFIYADQLDRELGASHIGTEAYVGFVPLTDSAGYLVDTVVDSFGVLEGELIPNFLSQAYDYLKGLPEFVGAISI